MASNPLQNTTFIKSVIDYHFCPEDTGIEIAFAGRSNSGKSTVINTLTGIKKLAKSSKTPGRTQMLNFFEVQKNKHLVDLPGFGYAKLPPKMREKWDELMHSYLSQRQSLVGIMLVMDSRHPLRDLDLHMIDIAVRCELKVHIILNKADKLKYRMQQATLNKVTNELNNLPAQISVQLFSTPNQQGINFAREIIQKWLYL